MLAFDSCNRPVILTISTNMHMYKYYNNRPLFAPYPPVDPCVVNYSIRQIDRFNSKRIDPPTVS